MYTWGYIKEAALSKLDKTADEAIQLGLMNKFPYAANEAITQISSAVKPKRTYADFKAMQKEKLVSLLTKQYPTVEYPEVLVKDKLLLTDTEAAFMTVYKSYVFVDEPVRLPADFVSFGTDINYVYNCNKLVEAYDDSFIIFADNMVLFLKEGIYKISYNARWFTFTPTTDADEILEIPADIIDCIPSYIASQCYKIDDEVKAAIYRNEYELFVARIDDNLQSKNKSIKIKGGW